MNDDLVGGEVINKKSVFSPINGKLIFMLITFVLIFVLAFIVFYFINIEHYNSIFDYFRFDYAGFVTMLYPISISLLLTVIIHKSWKFSFPFLTIYFFLFYVIIPFLRIRRLSSFSEIFDGILMMMVFGGFWVIFSLIIFGILVRFLFNKSYKKWIKVLFVFLPFVLLIIIVISSALTCNYGFDVVCSANKGTDVFGCYDEFNVYAMDECFVLLAKESDDYELCGEGELQYTKCSYYFALEKENLSICDYSSLRGGFGVSRCYKEYAKEKHDVVDCENIKDNDNRNACYLGIIDATGDVSICEKVISTVYEPSLWNKERCYSEFV